MSDWISTFEKLPPQNVRVLAVEEIIFTKDNTKLEIINIAYRLGSDWFDDQDIKFESRRNQSCLITHWMPLPDLPGVLEHGIEKTSL